MELKKTILALLVVFSLLSCSESDNADGTTVAEDADSSPLTYGDEANFVELPYSGIATFYYQSVSDIITAQDGSMWVITGTTGSSWFGDLGEVGFSVRTTTETMSPPSDPTKGIKGKYFMLVDSYPPPIYVNKLPPDILFDIGVATFQYHWLGDIITAQDGSMWVITGTTSRSWFGDLGEVGFSVYTTMSTMPYPLKGTKGKYFMRVDGDLSTIYVNKLPPDILFDVGVATIQNLSLGDIITAQDGSMWEITGTTESGRSTLSNLGEAGFSVYITTDTMPFPFEGTKGEYFMLFDGYVRTIFVNRL